MPRKATGQVVEKHNRRGVTFALRFRAYGRREYVTLGDEADGWTQGRAERELSYVLAQVERGEWQPPVPDPAPVPQTDRGFREFASEWYADLPRVGPAALAPKTLRTYEWEITNGLLPFFHRHRLSQVTVAEVDRYRAAKVREGKLSPESINKTLRRLGCILDVAEERGLIDRNPMRVNPKNRKLRAAKTVRSWLDNAAQIAALLDAATALDREGRAAPYRRALLATLIFAGLRIEEALQLRWRNVDLAAGRIHVEKGKTAAAARDIKLLPALRDELAAHKAGARHSRPGDRVFATPTGKAHSSSNIRNRLLARAVAKANAGLEESGLPTLPDPTVKRGRLTPHSFRRGFASLLFALGKTPPDVMAQMGHTDARLTLSVYTRVMGRSEDERAQLRALVAGEPLPTPVPSEARAVV